MPSLSSSARRRLALAGIAFSIAILIPGLALPVISLEGTLDPDGVSALAPQLIERGLTEETVEQMKPLLNPGLVPILENMPGGLQHALVNQLSGMIAGQLAEGEPIVVYRQTRSILGSVQHLYRVNSEIAATLILLFSVMVPFTKGALVLWAVLQAREDRRTTTLHFVEMIAKWSMADVFAVALIIAYLAAQASNVPPGAGYTQVVVFSATFGAGFYWFASYCLVSLATQQWTARWLYGRR